MEKDPRMNKITDWYNETLHELIHNRNEFINRFADENGEVDLATSPDVAEKYGGLKKEEELLNNLYSILLNDVDVIKVHEESDINNE